MDIEATAKDVKRGQRIRKKRRHGGRIDSNTIRLIFECGNCEVGYNVSLKEKRRLKKEESR